MEISGWRGEKKAGGGALQERRKRNHQTNAGPGGVATETKKNEETEKAKDRPRVGTACPEKKETRKRL
jgi:hypothetical protein